MANLYRFDRYRPAFADLFAKKRTLKQGWSTALLAERIGVQPSHITNVIKERNHFSSDQIYAIGGELGLTEEEMAYLDLLMEWERAEHPQRKQQLLTQIQSQRDQKLRVEKELKIQSLKLSSEENEKYYLDPNVELLHLYLGTKGVSVEAEQIARRWDLPVGYVAEILDFLQNVGLAEIKRGRWVVKPIHQLLPTSSPLCRPQQMLKRLRVMEVIQKTSPNEVYAFSGTLTMTEDTKLQIQARFVEFLKEIEKEVLMSEPENIYHLQFDLFPWIQHKKRS